MADIGTARIARRTHHDIELTDVCSPAMPMVRRIAGDLDAGGTMQLEFWMSVQARDWLVVEDVAELRDYPREGHSGKLAPRPWTGPDLATGRDGDVVAAVLGLTFEAMKERYPPPSPQRPESSEKFAKCLGAFHWIFERLGFTSLPFPKPFAAQVSLFGSEGHVGVRGVPFDVAERVTFCGMRVMSEVARELGLNTGYGPGMEQGGFAACYELPCPPPVEESALERLEALALGEAVLDRRPDLAREAEEMRAWCAAYVSSRC